MIRDRFSAALIIPARLRIIITTNFSVISVALGRNAGSTETGSLDRELTICKDFVENVADVVPRYRAVFRQQRAWAASDARQGVTSYCTAAAI